MFGSTAAGVLDVITQNILPIFIVAALGFWLRRSFDLDKNALSRLVFNGLSPALVFSSLTANDLPAGDLLRLALFAFLSILAMGGLGLAFGRLFRLPRADVIVLLLTLMFVNSGNYGLTLNELRYGAPGLSRAVVYYVVSTIMVYSLGVLLASMGRLSARAALAGLFRVPALYAVALALLVYGLKIPLPAPVARGIDLAGSGAIPVMIVVLGMNMADMDGLGELRRAVPATILRLAAGPVVAALLAVAVGLQGLNRSTAIIEASMPTAVFVTVLATEFDVQPTAVTAIVVLSTLLSPLTVALTITLLGL